MTYFAAVRNLKLGRGNVVPSLQLVADGQAVNVSTPFALHSPTFCSVVGEHTPPWCAEFAASVDVAISGGKEWDGLQGNGRLGLTLALRALDLTAICHGALLVTV